MTEPQMQHLRIRQNTLMFGVFCRDTTLYLMIEREMLNNCNNSVKKKKNNAWFLKTLPIISKLF